MSDDKNKETRVVTSHDIRLDGDYATWIAELKHRYRSAQVKAAVRVNAEKLLFNWQLGRDLVLKKAEQRWGTGVVEQVSLDLQREFPGDKGFATSNLWYMKRWYEFYTTEMTEQKLQQLVGELQLGQNQTNIKLQQVVGEIDTHKLYQVGREIERQKLNQVGKEIEPQRLHQLGGEFPLPFALVPWRHHLEILTKCKSIDEAFRCTAHRRAAARAHGTAAKRIARNQAADEQR